MEQKQETRKKKKSLAKRLGQKFGRGPSGDELVKETLSDLTDIVSSMKIVFEEFETGYEDQLSVERSSWKKMQSKLPRFLQAKELKLEEQRLTRIKSNRTNLSDLEDNLRKLDLVLSSGKTSFEAMGEAYINTAIPGDADSKSMNELEKRIAAIEENVGGAMEDMTAQISLIKSSIDNMAGQLDEQGVTLNNIDEKIDVIDSKLDRAQEALKKISRQLTGNRVMMIVIVGTSTAVILNKLVLS